MTESLRHRFYRLLRFTERYTKTDMVYLTKGGFWIGLSQVIYVPLALGLSIAFANLVPRDVYGVYRYVLSIAPLIGVFAFSGIDTALPQAVARGFEGMLRKGFATYLKWSWMMIVAGGAVALYYFMHGNATLAFAFLIVGAASPVIAGANLYTEFLTGKRAFAVGLWYGAANTAFTTGVIVAVMLVRPTPLALVAAYFGSFVVSALFLYRATIRRFHPNDAIDPESERFGMHLSVTNLLGTIADQLDKVLVFHLVGAAELAVYSFATALPDYVRSFTKGLAALATPKYAQREAASFHTTIVKKTLQLLLILGAATAVYVVGAPFLFRLMYPHYIDSIPYSQVYALTILSGAASLPTALITAQRAVKAQYLFTISDNVIRIALLIGFSLSFGVWGIIAARVLGRFLTLSISTFLAKNLS